MQINIIAIGKIKSSDYEQKMIDNYLSRIRWDYDLHIFESKLTGKAQTDKEHEFLLVQCNKRESYKIMLDEKGQNIDSISFAKIIEQAASSYKSIDFFIGGACGLNDEIRIKANSIISFGKLTWPHKLARLMLSEQIYRSYSILSNHPYHREG